MKAFGILLAVVLFGLATGYAFWLSNGGQLNSQISAPHLSNTQPPDAEPIIQTSQPAPKAVKKTVPILMYHYIRDYQVQSDQLGIQLSVSPAKLDTQLSLLERAGYETVTLTDWIENKTKVKKPIILTFDDGYDDHFTEALPILQQHNMVATFFIVGGFVGRPGYLTATQIASLKTAGMEIGGHSMSHLNLETAKYPRALEEITKSLTNTGSIFAYPSGKYSTETLAILTTLKVKAAVTTNLGLATDQSNPLELPRIRVKENTDILKIIAEEQARLSSVTQ